MLDAVHITVRNDMMASGSSLIGFNSIAIDTTVHIIYTSKYTNASLYVISELQSLGLFTRVLIIDA